MIPYIIILVFRIPHEIESSNKKYSEKHNKEPRNQRRETKCKYKPGPPFLHQTKRSKKANHESTFSMKRTKKHVRIKKETKQNKKEKKKKKRTRACVGERNASSQYGYVQPQDEWICLRRTLRLDKIIEKLLSLGILQTQISSIRSEIVSRCTWSPSRERANPMPTTYRERINPFSNT